MEDDNGDLKLTEHLKIESTMAQQLYYFMAANCDQPNDQQKVEMTDVFMHHLLTSTDSTAGEEREETVETVVDRTNRSGSSSGSSSINNQSNTKLTQVLPIQERSVLWVETNSVTKDGLQSHSLDLLDCEPATTPTPTILQDIEDVNGELDELNDEREEEGEGVPVMTPRQHLRAIKQEFGARKWLAIIVLLLVIVGLSCFALLS